MFVSNLVLTSFLRLLRLQKLLMTFFFLVNVFLEIGLEVVFKQLVIFVEFGFLILVERQSSFALLPDPLMKIPLTSGHLILYLFKSSQDPHFFLNFDLKSPLLEEL